MKTKTIDKNTYKLHIIKTKNFKTITVRVVLCNEIKKETITMNNFLCDLITYSSKKYNTRKEFANKLLDLYNCGLSCYCNRFGKTYNINLGVCFLDEKYTEKGMTEESIKFLSEVLYNPNVENNKFDKKSFDVVKDLTREQLKSINENTRQLSMIKMLELMGKDEEYSYRSCGYLEDLEKINESNIYEFYKNLLNNSKIDIYVVGNVDFDSIESLISKYFKTKKI